VAYINFYIIEWTGDKKLYTLEALIVVEQQK